MGTAKNGGVNIRHPKGAKLVHPSPGMFMTPSHNGCLMDITRVFSRKFQISNKEVSRLFQGNIFKKILKNISRFVQGSFMVVSREQSEAELS